MGVFAHTMPWMSLFLMTSCVVPIPATPEESDAGPRQDTPTIVKSSPIDFPGPLQLPGTPTLTLTLKDADITDTLYVRVFKNYGPGNESLGIANLTVSNDPVNGKVERTKELRTDIWCGPGSAGMNVIIDVVVADEPFEDVPSGDTPFKNPINNGRSSERNFVVACNQ